MGNRQFKLFIYGAVSFSFFWSLNITAVAFPLSLSDKPLVVSGAVDPNIMLMLDNSGSMSNIVPESPYDENTDYTNCLSDNQIAAGDDVIIDIRIKADGKMYFRSGDYFTGIDYDFGNNNDPGITGLTKKCFTDDDLYNARLFANSDSEPKEASGYLAASYKGNFLNWYLSNSDQSEGADYEDGVNRRPGTNTRMEIAKIAAESLVDGLDNVRMGLATYNSGEGGRIHEGIDDIDNNKAALKTTISNLTNGGATPIAETFETLGRYFVQGYESAEITLHPDSITGVEETIAANEVFGEPAYNDGVVVPTSDDPVIQYFCQKNFIIGLTDGRPQSDQDIDDKLQDYDGDCASTPTDCDEFNEFDKKDAILGYDYESNGSDYLDDVLLALNEIDLRPDLDKADGTEELNNIVTYLIGFADIQVQNDPLMADAAAAGGGGSFITASSSSDLSNTFAVILNDVFSQLGSVASVAFNSSQLNAGSAVFQAQFNTASWQGHLLAFPLSLTGAIGSQAWDAADVLDNMLVSDRHVFSYSEDTNEGIEFAWDNLSAVQQADLYQGVDSDKDGNSTNGNSTNDDEDAQLLLNYLLGDRSLEGISATSYRTRATRLGDIVNSTPVFVGKPQLSWPEYITDDKFGAAGDDYSSFKSGSAASRTSVLYVGANDGMLHGFNGGVAGAADDGKELMAYIPGAISSSAANEGLHYLSDVQYEHAFYVDLTPAVSDVYINDRAGSKAWRTVLIGGLRAGGRGLYALDITDPGEFSDPSTNAADVVLWEFTNDDDSDLGYTYSQPSIVMMANGKWAAIFGNGYNSDDNRAALFIVYLEEGIGGTWTLDDGYVKIYTDTIASPNGGLSTPRVVDIDGDSVADRVYAGDLNGNMWVFDIDDTSQDKWDVAHISPEKEPEPLFTAINSLGDPQPITTAPILAKNINVATDNSTEPNVLVLFGTGRFIEPTDVSNYTDIMSYYAVWDRQTSLLTRSDLVPRTLATSGDLRTVTGDVLDWSIHSGWYIDLFDETDGSDNPVETGERVVSESLLRRNILFFNSIIPESVECSSGGSGWLMVLEYDTGLAPSFATFDADKDSIILNDTDDIGKVGLKFENGVPAKSGILGEKQYTPGSDGTIQERDIYVGKGGREGRLSWQELLRDY